MPNGCLWETGGMDDKDPVATKAVGHTMPAIRSSKREFRFNPSKETPWQSMRKRQGGNVVIF